MKLFAISTPFKATICPTKRGIVLVNPSENLTKEQKKAFAKTLSKHIKQTNHVDTSLKSFENEGFDSFLIMAKNPFATEAGSKLIVAAIRAMCAIDEAETARLQKKRG